MKNLINKTVKVVAVSAVITLFFSCSPAVVKSSSGHKVKLSKSSLMVQQRIQQKNNQQKRGGRGFKAR